MINRIKVYSEALRVYGEHRQDCVAMEELCEASAAISHFKRGKIDKSQLLNELADATIVIQEQLQYKNLTPEDLEQAIDTKITRLAKRITEKELQTNTGTEVKT